MTNFVQLRSFGTGERHASNFVAGPLAVFSSADEVITDPQPVARDIRKFEKGILRMGEKGKCRVVLQIVHPRKSSVIFK
jgi:hypothetical protein